MIGVSKDLKSNEKARLTWAFSALITMGLAMILGGLVSAKAPTIVVSPVLILATVSAAITVFLAYKVIRVTLRS